MTPSSAGTSSTISVSRTDLDDPIGVKLQFADRLRFEDNYVHDGAHNGVQLSFVYGVSDEMIMLPGGYAAFLTRVC